MFWRGQIEWLGLTAKLEKKWLCDGGIAALTPSPTRSIIPVLAVALLAPHASIVKLIPLSSIRQHAAALIVIFFTPEMDRS